MKEYFYMFSAGEYSDYCVGGLYKSNHQLTKEWFGHYLKNKLVQNNPEYEDFIQNLSPDIDILQGDSWKEDLWNHSGKPPRPDWRDRDVYNSWWASYHPWKESFNTDFIKMVTEEDILEYVEYEEIWSH